jgi:hypothetical protein
MKKLRIPTILIASLVVLGQIGCKSPMQVTNNSANTAGPWVGQLQNPEYPLVLGDSTGGALTAVFDISTREVTGAIFSKNDTNEVIFIGDSGLPTRIISGTKEIMLANYTDTSVDVVATDTAGSIGVQPNVDIREALSNVKVHSNKVSRAGMKAKVPNNVTLFEEDTTIGQIISNAKDLGTCILAIIDVLTIEEPGVGTIVETAISKWMTPSDLWTGCSDLFKDVVESLISSGAFKAQPAPPSSYTLSAPGAVYGAAAFLDSAIGNKPAMIEWTESMTGPILNGDTAPCIGSYFMESGPLTFPTHALPCGRVNGSGCGICISAAERGVCGGSCEGITLYGNQVYVTGNRRNFVQFSGNASWGAGADTLRVVGAAQF